LEEGFQFSDFDPNLRGRFGGKNFDWAQFWLFFCFLFFFFFFFFLLLLDLLLIIAFSELYSITIICLTDYEETYHSSDLQNLDFVPSVFFVESKKNHRNGFAVLGVACEGRSFVPLLPATYCQQLQRAHTRNWLEKSIKKNVTTLKSYNWKGLYYFFDLSLR
jgi:hypothetical protein